jgi:predicted DNA binding protein
MPRGVKGSGPQRGKSIDARIAENDALIESLQEQLSEAKAKKKPLQQSKGNSEMAAIQKIIQKSGLTPEQLKALIEAKHA